jgi:hypothetical protein
LNVKREHGVGFAVRNKLLKAIIPPTKGSERILEIQMQTTGGLIIILSAYAPTVTSTPQSMDQFYEDLNKVISEVPERQPLYILGD